jgi:hypothetical protein
MYISTKNRNSFPDNNLISTPPGMLLHPKHLFPFGKCKPAMSLRWGVDLSMSQEAVSKGQLRMKANLRILKSSDNTIPFTKSQKDKEDQ